MANVKIIRQLMSVIAVATVAIAAWVAGPADAAFQFKKIVDSNTPLPDGSGNFKFSVTSLPHVSGDWVVFNASDPANSLTVWRANLRGRKLKKLITQQTFIPGWKDEEGNRLTFNQLYGNFMQIHGETLVLVALPCAGCNSGVGIFARSLFGGPISNLVDKKDEHQELAEPPEDQHFGNFSEDFRIAGNLVVFSNRGKVFTVPLGGGALTAVAGVSTETNNVAPPCPLCPIFGGPSLQGEKVLLTAGNVLGKGSVQSVRSNGAKKSWRLIAGHGMRAPKTPSDYGFIDNQFWGPILDGQAMIFGGASTLDAEYGNPAIFGIYSRSDRLRRLADSTMPVPGGTGNFEFVWGGERTPILADDGIVVFGAQDADHVKGLYAVPQNGGRIRKIIAEGDTIGGRTVGFLNIGRGALDGSTLVFTVGFTDFSNGIYSTQIVLP